MGVACFELPATPLITQLKSMKGWKFPKRSFTFLYFKRLRNGTLSKFEEMYYYIQGAKVNL